jgi:hypothetical protein
VRAGLVLLAAAAAGMVLANSPLSGAYAELFHDTRLSIALTGRWGFALDHSLVEWVNELLMPIFFLLVGLEIKREMVDGQLRTWRAASLPVFAAAGGVVVPAGIFLALAWMRGGDAPRVATRRGHLAGRPSRCRGLRNSAAPPRDHAAVLLRDQGLLHDWRPACLCTLDDLRLRIVRTRAL